MRIFITLLLISMFFLPVQAEYVNGYYRNNGTYVMGYNRNSGLSNNSFRNSYSNPNTVNVMGYTRSNGTYVKPYTRTAPNNTVRDNFNYRGY